MPLYLCRPGIHHGTGEYCQDSRGWVQHSFIHDRLVLLDPCRKRDIIILGPTSQWVEQ